jgi:predicted alpha/beta hydrolase
MGENLPKNVAKQWAEFCSQPGYVMNAIGKSIFHDFHNEIQCPITSFGRLMMRLRHKQM